MEHLPNWNQKQKARIYFTTLSLLTRWQCPPQVTHLQNTLWSLQTRSFQKCFANVKDRSFPRRDPSCSKATKKIIIASGTASQFGIWSPFQALSTTSSHKDISLHHPLLATTWKWWVFHPALGENSWQSNIYRGRGWLLIHLDSCLSPSFLMESSWAICKGFRLREEGEVELAASW